MLGVTVCLSQFEGPLGLLLYLIRKEEMDIMDINIYQITEQYLSYIRNMKTLDLENAGDFVAMAATLIHIKSKMILPDYGVSEDEEISEDPRTELVQKLIEYQKFKEASQRLYERNLLNRDIWCKGAKESLPSPSDGHILVEDNALFGLIKSYRKVVRRAKNSIHRVSARMQSVASRILELKKFLKPGQWVSFFEIMGDQEIKKELFRPKLLVTFLSLLELGKMGVIHFIQSKVYGDIHIEVQEEFDGNMISQVEEYENLDTLDDFSSISSQRSKGFDEEAEDVEVASDRDIEEEEKSLTL